MAEWFEPWRHMWGKRQPPIESYATLEAAEADKHAELKAAGLSTSFFCLFCSERNAQLQAETYRLMLEEPAEFRRRLDGFRLLVGDSRLWWQCVPQAKDQRWPECIRRAIDRFARRSQVEPRWLARYLDEDAPRLRESIISLAARYLEGP